MLDLVEPRPGLGAVRRDVRHRRVDPLARERGRDVHARAGVRRQPGAVVVEVVDGERDRFAVARAGGRRQRFAPSAPTAAASIGSETS